MAGILCIGNLLMLSGMSFAVCRANLVNTATAGPTAASPTINIVALTATAADVFPNETNTAWDSIGEILPSPRSNVIDTVVGDSGGETSVKNLKSSSKGSSILPSSTPFTSHITATEEERFRLNVSTDTIQSTWPTISALIAAKTQNDNFSETTTTPVSVTSAHGSIADVSTSGPPLTTLRLVGMRTVMRVTTTSPNRLPVRLSTPLAFALRAMHNDNHNDFGGGNAITSTTAIPSPTNQLDAYSQHTTDGTPTSSDYTDIDANISAQYSSGNETLSANDFGDFYPSNDSKSILVLPSNSVNYNDIDDDDDDAINPIATGIVVAELKSSPIVISDTSASGGNGGGGDSVIHWPVKKEAIMEGNLILGGLMMVHSREDTITCGPIMPQGGIQALEVMLFTLDRINEIGFLPNISLGAHILDDCDKDTYGLEMAVDFIKGESIICSHHFVYNRFIAIICINIFMIELLRRRRRWWLFRN